MILSVLIPTYNRPNQLIKAIDSCLDYTDGNIEIIIGDDSDLSSRDLITKIDLPRNYRLVYLYREQALKQNKNVADLIRQAKGKYSLILHDDDYLLPNGISRLINSAQASLEENVIFFGKQKMIDDTDNEIPNNLNEDYFRIKEYLGLQKEPLKMALLQQVPSNSFLFSTAVGKEIGYRDYEKVGDACDFDFILRLVLNGKCKLFFLNEYISTYRLSDNSVSRSNSYNSIFYKYETIKEFKIDKIYPNLYSKLIDKDLNVLCGYYINNKLQTEMKTLYFSEHYAFKRKFTLRGIYHLLRCFY